MSEGCLTANTLAPCVATASMSVYAECSGNEIYSSKVRRLPVHVVWRAKRVPSYDPTMILVSCARVCACGTQMENCPLMQRYVGQSFTAATYDALKYGVCLLGVKRVPEGGKVSHDWREWWLLMAQVL